MNLSEIDDEILKIASGEIIDHSTLSKLVAEGKAKYLKLIIFNKYADDGIKLKALKRISNPDYQELDLKTKKSLISQCLKKNNFGNQEYYEGKKILEYIRNLQKQKISEIVKAHKSFILKEQGANSDVDFKNLITEIDLMRNAQKFQLKLGRWTHYESFWNYILMANWAGYLEENPELNFELNKSLMAELEEVIALDEWLLLDSTFDEIQRFDTLIYSAVHEIHIQVNNNIDRTNEIIKQANEVIANFDKIINYLEKEMTKFYEKQRERRSKEVEAIRERQRNREDSVRQRPKYLSVTHLESKGEASVNNRWA